MNESIDSEAASEIIDDGDQVVRMHIEQGTESLYSGDDDNDYVNEIDPEVSFRKDQDSQSSLDDQSMSGRSSGESDDEVVEEQDNNVDVTGSQKATPQKQKKSRQQRLAELDQEMQQKVKELQSLMYESGLEGAAAMMKDLPIAKKGKQNNHQIVHYNVKENSNSNSTVQPKNGQKKINTSNSKSEETIYTQAVHPKRNSSSSEEGEIANVSDETMDLDVQNFLLEQIPCARNNFSRNDERERD